MEFIKSQGGVNLVIDPQVISEHECSGKTITLRLRKISALRALRLILEFNGLAMEFRNKVLLVTLPENLIENSLLRIYDVRHILRKPTYEPGEVLDLFDVYKRIEHLPESREEDNIDIEDLACMIQESVDPETWDEPGASITSLSGSLVITNHRKAHEQVRRLLMTLESMNRPSLPRGQCRRLQPAPGGHALSQEWRGRSFPQGG